MTVPGIDLPGHSLGEFQALGQFRLVAGSIRRHLRRLEIGLCLHLHHAVKNQKFVAEKAEHRRRYSATMRAFLRVS
jgi:hypothetical protein